MVRKERTNADVAKKDEQGAVGDSAESKKKQAPRKSTNHVSKSRRQSVGGAALWNCGQTCLIPPPDVFMCRESMGDAPTCLLPD